MSTPSINYFNTYQLPMLNSAYPSLGMYTGMPSYDNTIFGNMFNCLFSSMSFNNTFMPFSFMNIGNISTGSNIGGRKIDLKSLGISQTGINLIKRNEGCILHAYWDVNGYGIGYGHHGNNIGKNTTITKAQAEEYLKQDLTKYVKYMKSYVKVPLSQNQFDACISLMYNMGNGGFKNSDVCKYLNQGKYKEAADSFLKYNKSNGKVLDGLTKRRKEERALFLKG